MHSKLEWSHIEVFVATYEEKGMARAAEKLHVSPPYITKIIKEMEKILDTEMFVREANGVSPTNDAHRVYAESSALIERFRQLRLQLHALHSEIRGEVNIGVLPALPGTLLVRAIDGAIRESTKSYPHIQIKIIESRGAGLIELLQQKTIDLAFVQISSASPTIISKEIFSEHLMLVAHKDMLKGIDRIKTAQSLSKFPLIFQTERGSMRTLIENACREEGYNLVPAFEIDAIALQLQMCINGHGACILPANACIDNSFLDRLAYVPITIPSVNRTLYITRNENYLSPQANVVLNFLLRHIEDEIKHLTPTKLIQLPR